MSHYENDQQKHKTHQLNSIFVHNVPTYKDQKHCVHHHGPTVHVKSCRFFFLSYSLLLYRVCLIGIMVPWILFVFQKRLEEQGPFSIQTVHTVTQPNQQPLPGIA